jgi:hypothetical protein
MGRKADKRKQIGSEIGLNQNSTSRHLRSSWWTTRSISCFGIVGDWLLRTAVLICLGFKTFISAFTRLVTNQPGKARIPSTLTRFADGVTQKHPEPIGL